MNDWCGTKVCKVSILDHAKIFTIKCLQEAGLQFVVEKMI